MKALVPVVRRVVTRSLTRPRSLFCLILAGVGLLFPAGWILPWLFVWTMVFGALAVSSALDEDFIRREGIEVGLEELGDGLPLLGEAPPGQGDGGEDRSPLQGREAERFRFIKRLASSIRGELDQASAADGLAESRIRIQERLEGMVEASRRLCVLRGRIAARDPRAAIVRLDEERAELAAKRDGACGEDARRRWEQALRHKEESGRLLARLETGAERIDSELDELQGELEVISNRLAALSLGRRDDPLNEDDLRGRLGEIVDEVAVLEESLAALEL